MLASRPVARVAAVLAIALLVAGCTQANTSVPSPLGTVTQPASGKPPNVPTAAPPSVPTVSAPAGIKPSAGTNVEYLPLEPMGKLLTAKKGAVRDGGPLKVPVITWGADVATIHANGGRSTQTGSIFAREGLNIELSREDDFVRAVDKVVAGETPFLRGTVDMIASASEALADRGIEMVVVYQLSWSNGGDTITIRSDQVSSLTDLRGRAVGLQRFGPHMLYLATVLRDGGVSLSDVKIRWLRELTQPPYDTKGVAVDPMTAMQRDPDLAAVTVISPDMLALTNGGGVGTGAESSVKGAKLLLSTKTAGHVIADVYAVRKDYLDANRATVQKFVHGLMLAQEELTDLYNQRQQRSTDYQQLLRQSAEILRDSPQATSDIDGLLGDCTLVDFAANTQFFTGQGTIRSLAVLTEEAQDALLAYGLIAKKVPLAWANWDYSQLSQGLRNTGGAVVQRFDPAKAGAVVEKREASGGAEGSLFSFNIGFAPNQNEFSVDQYRADFERAIKLAATYPGALIVIEGHSDPTQYVRLTRQPGVQPVQLEQTKTAAKNLSLARALKVRQALIDYAKGQNVQFDPSQFAVAGLGIERPVHPNPTVDAEAAENRRVTFKLIQIEAEIESVGSAQTSGAAR